MNKLFLKLKTCIQILFCKIDYVIIFEQQPKQGDSFTVGGITFYGREPGGKLIVR